MLKRCSNCKHCKLEDWALKYWMFIYRCHSIDSYKWDIDHPFWSGWFCKGWERKDGK